MKEITRQLAFARHQYRDKHLMPLVELAFEQLKLEGVNLFPPTMRQAAIMLRYYRDFESRRSLLVKDLKRSMTGRQHARVKNQISEQKFSIGRVHRFISLLYGGALPEQEQSGTE